MKRERANMTVTVVPLQSDEAGDGRVDGTAAQRLAIVADLSRRMWALTRRPVPAYTRETIPLRLTTLGDQ